MEPPFQTALVAGGIAGVSVDLSLFPIDTIKTRLQAPHGFFKAGGFQRIYSGVGVAGLGSFPSAGLFFATYETVKPYLKTFGNDWMAESSAATCGEIIACLVRVPTEVVKQRMQVENKPFRTVVKQMYARGGTRQFVFSHPRFSP